MWKGLAGLALTANIGIQATAQTYPYTLDFETAGAKSYASTDPITVDNIDWIMPGVYLGNMITPPGDFFNDLKAARMRLSNNSSGDPGYMMMTNDLPSGIGELSFNTAMYGSESGGRLVVLYSTDQGANWTMAGDTIDVPANASPLAVSRIINTGGAIRISINKAETSNARINVDDIVMTSFGVQTSLMITETQPSGDNVPLTTQSLSISFDEDIVATTGTLSLFTASGDETTFDIPADVTITDNTATVSGINLANATSYYVNITEGAFTNLGGNLASLAINDQTTWAFTTVDTTPAPPMTSLNETFSNCTNEAMGMFTQFSISGNKTWHCSNFGRDDSAAVEINGGSGTGVSEINEDWLISVAPFDLSNMEAPTLSFWENRRFEGQVIRTIQISTDYLGAGDPAAATWTQLQVQELDAAPPLDSWAEISDIQLIDFKDSPFYLAFTYTCGDAGTYALSYDDIRIQDGSSIAATGRGAIDLYVLGQATRNNIRLQINLQAPADLQIQVLDLSGRIIHTQSTTATAGSNQVLITPGTLQGGLYIIKVQQGSKVSTVKAVVQ